MDEQDKGQMVVKANRLVQAKMPLSKLEHRVVALLISQLDKDDESFGFQKLFVKDLQMTSGNKDAGRLYQRAEEICSSLLDKKIEVKRKKDGKRKYRGINLMDECRYEEGKGYIQAKFNDSMEEFLLQLKRRFTMYEAGYYVPLQSTHSMRIYEMLKMREGISVLRISIEELRDILGVADSYEYFSALKAHVIKKAQQEIEEKTDIYFTYDVEREGRSAERIKFFIHSEDEEPQQPTRVEDRTEAPDIDVVSMFKADLTQDELDSLSNEAVQKLHERATQQARAANPDGGKAMLQAETYRRMKQLWTS
jgi:plasmid replication initiation protein